MHTTLQGEVVAVETHAARFWALLMLPALVMCLISVALYDAAPARFALVFMMLIGTPALALVLGGFEYRFLRHGVEIRTLGYRLRTIPKTTIISYSIEPWAMIRGGYGIRFRPGTCAYVWGNKVIHIRTTNGEVYLGHSDPKKIVQHLDEMTGLVSRG